MQRTRFIDIFSGAGLFSAGFVANQFEPVLAVDLAKEAVASYNLNLAPVAVCGSVANFEAIPRAEVLIAGPPCQGFSTLGRMDPLDHRNSLALDIPRWSEVCGADVVIVENVPPFLKSAQWGELARQLHAQGFDVSTWILDAVEFGAPQLRRRAFTLASKIGPIAEPQSSEDRVTAGTALSRPISAGDTLHTWPTPTRLAAARIALVPPNGDKRDVMRLAPELCPPSWERVGCHATDVWGRIDPEQPSNTLRCNFQNPSKGRYLHPTEDRVLSLREGARLQGVPEHWRFVGRPYPVARQIGNGVPVPLSTVVAAAVREAFERIALKRAA